MLRSWFSLVLSTAAMPAASARSRSMSVTTWRRFSCKISMNVNGVRPLCYNLPYDPTIRRSYSGVNPKQARRMLGFAEPVAPEGHRASGVGGSAHGTRRPTLPMPSSQLSGGPVTEREGLDDPAVFDEGQRPVVVA